jgi:hypothetical protein
LSGQASWQTDCGSPAAGSNTPELDVASNDHAIGEIVDAVSHSPYWSSTAIFIEEDDAQAGDDRRSLRTVALANFAAQR